MSLESSAPIKHALEAIDDFCRELVREGFATKANLQVEPAPAQAQWPAAKQILERFLLRIRDAAQKDDHREHVQIKADNKEMFRRITAFMAHKRMEVDELNVQEFCNRISVNEAMENSCARTDAVVVKRTGSNSHVKISRVVNQCGPQTAPAPQDDDCKENDEKLHQLQPPSAVEERVENMEAHLKTTSTNKRKLFERLKTLEDRILFLEGISPDYFKSSVQKSPKRRCRDEYKPSRHPTMTLQEIDARIASLKKSLVKRRDDD